MKSMKNRLGMALTVMMLLSCTGCTLFGGGPKDQSETALADTVETAEGMMPVKHDEAGKLSEDSADDVSLTQEAKQDEAMAPTVQEPETVISEETSMSKSTETPKTVEMSETDFTEETSEAREETNASETQAETDTVAASDDGEITLPLVP